MLLVVGAACSLLALYSIFQFQFCYSAICLYCLSVCYSVSISDLYNAYCSIAYIYIYHIIYTYGRNTSAAQIIGVSIKLAGRAGAKGRRAAARLGT
jgi:hypothetical protein